jgi:hypothetical protein
LFSAKTRCPKKARITHGLSQFPIAEGVTSFDEIDRAVGAKDRYWVLGIGY